MKKYKLCLISVEFSYEMKRVLSIDLIAMNKSSLKVY